MRSSKGRWIAGAAAACALLVVLGIVLQTIPFRNDMSQKLESGLRDEIAERLRAAMTARAAQPVPPELVDQALLSMRLQNGGIAPSREAIQAKLQEAWAEAASRPFPPEAMEHVLHATTAERIKEAMIRLKDAPPTKVETKVIRIPK